MIHTLNPRGRWCYVAPRTTTTTLCLSRVDPRAQVSSNPDHGDICASCERELIWRATRTRTKRMGELQLSSLKEACK